MKPQQSVPYVIPPPSPFLDVLCFGTPFLLIALIWFAFYVSPDFFLAYILSEANREFQLIEIITFLSALAAGVLLAYGARQFWKRGWKGASALVSVYTIATLFFAGEEISWGQSYFSWVTPDWWDQHIAYETNFHNSRVSVWGFHHLAGIFQLVMFGVLPCLWVFRERVPSIQILSPAIPEWPVVSFVVVAFLYRESKNIYMWMFPHDQFFQDFIWGFNEHREMLVALALLFYAVYRIKLLNHSAAALSFFSPTRTF